MNKSLQAPLVAVILFGLLLGVGLAKEPTGNTKTKGKRPAKEVAAAMWKRIQNSKADPDDKRAFFEYWLDINWECYRAYQTIDQADDPDAVIKFLVDQFGKHGAEADLRWLFTFPDAVLIYTARIAPAAKEKRFEDIFRRRMKLSKYVVAKCIKDEAFLKRWYRAELWANGFRFNPRDWGDNSASGFPVSYAFREVKRGLQKYDLRSKKRTKFLYWHYAKCVVFLAHAFHRDDLLKGADPRDLKKPFLSLEKWWRKNADYMELDKSGSRWKLNVEAKKNGKQCPATRMNAAVFRSPFPELDPKLAPNPDVLDVCEVRWG